MKEGAILSVQCITVSGKEYHIRIAHVKDGDITAAMSKLQRERRDELQADDCFYFSKTQEAIEQYSNNVFYLHDGNYLIQCGALETYPLRQHISESTCIEYVVSDFMLYCTTDGFYVLPECTGDRKCTKIGNYAYSPTIYHKKSDTNSFVLLEYGKVYEPTDFEEVMVVRYIPSYFGRNQSKTTVEVYKNREQIRTIGDVTDYFELPIEPEWIVYTKERSANWSFRKRYVLYNYLNDLEYPLCRYGGNGCYRDSAATIASLLVDWDTTEKPISDRGNIYFYICDNHTYAAEYAKKCALAVGDLKQIPNAFPNDSTQNYILSFPRKQQEVIQFVLYLIGKGKLYPKIWGCDVCDVIKGLVGLKDDIPEDERKLDLLSINRVIAYIRERYKGIEDSEIVKLLAITYGSISLQTQHGQYWPYFHCERISHKRFSLDASIILGRNIYSYFHNSLADVTNNAKWKSEQQLFQIVLFHYPDALFQYHDKWLGQQHIDIFIPSLRLAIEYQGKQHYEPIDFFGGEEGLEERRRLDELKRKCCRENDITLIEWDYRLPINDINFIFILKEKGYTP